MLQIIIGSFLLSILHAMIPNHWIPLIAIGKSEKWTRRQLLSITAMVGSAHTLGTIIIGIAIGLVGYNLSESYQFITQIATPIVFVALGIVFIILDLKSTGAHHHVHIEEISHRPRLAIIFSLCCAMFLSPCIEIVVYYLPAGSQGIPGIIIVSLIYLIVTVSGMVLLVDLGRKGIEKIKWHFLEHHSKLVTGFVLIAFGVFAYFIDL